MQVTTSFKFNPFWIVFIDLLIALFFYKCFSYLTMPLISWDNFFRCLIPLFFTYIFLPITLRMIFNIPAIVLTDAYLKNNFRGYAIEWADISDIELSDKGYRSFGSLNINLKEPDKYFNTPIKNFFYKARQLFSVDDFSIRVDFVAGSNEEIFETVKAYWTKGCESKAY